MPAAEALQAPCASLRCAFALPDCTPCGPRATDGEALQSRQLSRATRSVREPTFGCLVHVCPARGRAAPQFRGRAAAPHMCVRAQGAARPARRDCVCARGARGLRVGGHAIGLAPLVALRMWFHSSTRARGWCCPALKAVYVLCCVPCAVWPWRSGAAAPPPWWCGPVTVRFVMVRRIVVV
jgi:hypothetical protein